MGNKIELEAAAAAAAEAATVLPNGNLCAHQVVVTNSEQKHLCIYSHLLVIGAFQCGRNVYV